MLLFKPSSTLAKRSKQRPDESFSESRLTDSIEATETLIRKWISPDPSASSSSLFSTDNRVEGRRFVEVINSLQYAIQGVTLVNPDSRKLTRAHHLVTIAMKHLEKEFYRILDQKVSNVPISEDADVVTDLKTIADCMISCGQEDECVKIYKKIRRSIIVEALNKLGFENLSFGKTQKLKWERLEKNIPNWLKATKIVIANLFVGERILSEQVFSKSVSVAESCFAEITLDSALTLFIFPVSVARCRKTVEKIFLTLDVYERISKLLPQIEEIFSYDSTSSVRLQADDSLKRLGEAINSMVAEFEASITKESSKKPIRGGGVHHLTRYVMNFIVFLADYNDSLAGVLTESNIPLPEDYLRIKEDDNNERGETESSSSPVTTRLAWLILVLLCKIDTKSRIYNDRALSYLFLANNLHYVVSKVRTSNLRVVLGDEWVTNHERKVSRYLEKYEKLAWREVMTSLSDGEKMLEEDVAKERLKRFNEAFEEAFQKQSSWVVPDSKLRDGLRDSVAKKLTDVASSFYGKYNVETWKDIVSFVPEDLNDYLSDLYLGTGGSCIIVPSVKPPESGRSELSLSEG